VALLSRKTSYDAPGRRQILIVEAPVYVFLALLNRSEVPDAFTSLVAICD
jgi:hypothetical protein